MLFRTSLKKMPNPPKRGKGEIGNCQKDDADENQEITSHRRKLRRPAVDPHRHLVFYRHYNAPSDK